MASQNVQSIVNFQSGGASSITGKVSEVQAHPKTEFVKYVLNGHKLLAVNIVLLKYQNGKLLASQAKEAEVEIKLPAEDEVAVVFGPQFVVYKKYEGMWKVAFDDAKLTSVSSSMTTDKTGVVMSNVQTGNNNTSFMSAGDMHVSF